MWNELFFGAMSCLAAALSTLVIPTCTILQKCGLMAPVTLNTPDLSGKIAIVTGANTGVGKATAKQLAARGATVILACRSLTRGQSAVEDILASIGPTCLSGSSAVAGNVVTMELDLSDFRSIKQFVATFSKAYGKLDILVNNAGINGMVGPGQPKRTKQGLEIVFGSNYVGHFLLTNLLLDLLKASPDGRIVNLSSVMHHFASKDIIPTVTGENESHGYDDSKLAMLLFTLELRRRLASTRVLATAVNPGFVASDIWRGLHTLPTVGRLWSGICYLFALTVDQAAMVSVAAATAPRPPHPKASRKSANLDDDSPPAAPLLDSAAQQQQEEPDMPAYLQPYYLPLGIKFPFELFGPFAGPRKGYPTLPPDEPRLSAELWRQSEVLCART